MAAEQANYPASHRNQYDGTGRPLGQDARMPRIKATNTAHDACVKSWKGAAKRSNTHLYDFPLKLATSEKRFLGLMRLSSVLKEKNGGACGKECSAQAIWTWTDLRIACQRRCTTRSSAHPRITGLTISLALRYGAGETLRNHKACSARLVWDSIRLMNVESQKKQSYTRTIGPDLLIALGECVSRISCSEHFYMRCTSRKIVA